jgi:hypothetical protein
MMRLQTGEGEEKRKKRDRITYDEIVMIDFETRTKKKRRKMVKEKRSNEVKEEERNEEKHILQMTPPIVWRRDELPRSPSIITFALNEEQGREKEEKGGKEERGQEGEEREEEKRGEEEVQKWPGTTRKWWIEFVLILKFQERLCWAWKQCTKSFKGSLLIPVEVFMFFFGTMQRKKETKNQIKFVIETKQNLKQADKIFETSQLRKKKFYHKDLEETSHYQGTCKVVLQIEKKLTWIGGAYLPCLCLLEFTFDKNKSLLSFGGVVEGRNKVKAFRF